MIVSLLQFAWFQLFAGYAYCDINTLLRESPIVSNCVTAACPCTKGYVSIQGVNYVIDACKDDLQFAHDVMSKKGCAAPAFHRFQSEDQVSGSLSREDYLLLAYVASTRGVNVTRKQDLKNVEIKAVMHANTGNIFFIDSDGPIVFVLW